MIKRWWRRVAVVVATTLSVVLLAGVAGATNPFVDIAGTGPHLENIDAIYMAGVTAGCATPNSYCPNDPVTRAQMASFLARGLGLNNGVTRNFPKANARSSHQAYCSLARNVPNSYDLGPCTTTRMTVDALDDVGDFSSIAIGGDGYPVISYYHQDLKNLKVAKCVDEACIAPARITTVDFTDDVGSGSSIAIGVDGLPRISYYDETNGALKLARCADVACANTTSISTIDGSEVNSDVGEFTSLAIDADGNPIIAYYDGSNTALKVAACTDALCADPITITTVDTAGVVGLYPSLAMAPDGNPIISYPVAVDFDLKVAKCANAACSGAATITTVDSTGDVGGLSSIAIGSDGLPIISYGDATLNKLKVAKCVNDACTGSSTITAIDTGTAGAGGTSITIGSDGLPVIAYRIADGFLSLRVARCTNLDCTAAGVSIVDRSSAIGEVVSIALGIDGRPIVSYDNATSDNLMVARPPLL